MAEPGEVLIREPGTVLVRPGPPSPMDVIAAILRDPSIPIERVAAAMDLQERMEAREAEKEFNRDFALATMEMPKVAKRGKKDMKEKGCIAYETYEDLDAAIRPVETRYGFARSFSTRISEKGNGVILVLTLTHRAGHSRTSERYCPPDTGPGRNETQAISSGESYGRRYLSKSIWNIVTVGADDDGDSADPISQEQAADIHQWLSLLALEPTRMAKLWAWIGPPAVSVSTIQRGQYEKVSKYLKGLLHAQGGGR